MPTFTRGDTSIHYEVHGSGHPVLLFAPGGVRSSIAFWEKTPFNPMRELADRFRVIAMDQRNAGQSRGPVAPTDSWNTYTADHLALLDHLGVGTCHVLGMCIGCSFCLGIIGAAPTRITAAVLEQPIGFSGTNRPLFHQMFDGWIDELGKTHPGLSRPALLAVKETMYSGDFVFSATRDDVRACPVPLLVLRGNDQYHPPEISEEVARIAPRAELVPSWKEGDDLPRALARVKSFLAEHTP
jgi:pimeloyl-ACP methyl ester carboxylesterase